MKKKNPILEKLKQIAPSLQFRAIWTEDESFQWDGDGPDPKRLGYLPHDVEVRCSAIVAGEMLSGEDYLGGCYDKPGKLCPDVHGYFPQMAEEAASNLLGKILSNHPGSPVESELNRAITTLQAEMRSRYEAQQNKAA